MLSSDAFATETRTTLDFSGSCYSDPVLCILSVFPNVHVAVLKEQQEEAQLW